MPFLKYQRLVLLFFIYILTQINNVRAKIFLSNGTATSIAFPSTDVFLHPESYYHYEGIAFVWHFADALKPNMTCAFPPINASDPLIRNMANDAYQHTDFAIIIDYSLSKFVGCTTKEQIQLDSAAITRKFPPIKLFIIVSNTSPAFFLDYDHITGVVDDTLKRNIKPGIKMISVIDTPDLSFMKQISSFKRFYYAVEQEPNSWDILFASNSYIAYKWIYFTMVLVALLYTCARVIKLARLNMLKQNLFWLHLLLLFLVHLAALEKAYIASAFLNLYIILAKLPFDIIVWHWSIIGKRLFSKTSIIFVRLIAIIDIIVNIFQIISLIVTINHNKDYDTITPYTTPFIRFMRLVLPWVAIAIFCGLALWFGLTSYRLRRHHEGRRKFIQLACLTVLALFTYILFPSCSIYYGMSPLQLEPNELLTKEFMFDTSYMIRAFVFLTVLGMEWPYSLNLVEPEIRAPLGGMTTIEYDSTAEEVPIQWRLTRKITRMIKR
ncbi:hypothetical protein BDF19DRAFT_441530 [Syncephalis fuscata]|nr:hypothetical protein BDF19DRAFT_441530 [Syncephalis fuscata]